MDVLDAHVGVEGSRSILFLEWNLSGFKFDAEAEIWIEIRRAGSYEYRREFLTNFKRGNTEASIDVSNMTDPMNLRLRLKVVLEKHGKRLLVGNLDNFVPRVPKDSNKQKGFLKIIKETGLPAKIITNTNGKKKFELRLKELEITNYEIKSGVVGDEKVDFIKSARVHLNPSLRENYPFTFFECLGHMPCVVIDKSEWVTNFDKKYYIRKPVAEAGEAIKAVYGMKPEKWYGNGALQYIKDLDSGTAKYWKDFVESYKPLVTAKSDSAKINEYSEIKYIDFVRILNRSFLAIDDVKSVLTNRSKYNIIYTDKDTYLAKDPNFVPKEKETTNLESLFA
jgi:hypothetical protein